VTIRTLLAAAVAGTAFIAAMPASAQSGPTAPPAYNSCVGSANGNIVAVNPRSCVASSVSGFPGGGGQITGARASIINGREDVPNTGVSEAGTASTSWSDNGWTNGTITTSNASSVARGTASLADGTVKAFASNPTPNTGQGFVLSTISDIVTFNNTTGSAINLRIGYSFDGQFTNGQNNNFDNANVYLALNSPSSNITFANSGFGVGGYGLSRGWADGFFDQQWFFAGNSSDFDITSFGNPVSGPFGGGISTLISIPVGQSSLGFTLSLDLTCRVSGSTCDFGNTSAFNFDPLPTGLSFTSASGTLFSGRNQQPVAGVPEPATWAMMLMGFGFVGGALRRRSGAATRIRFA